MSTETYTLTDADRRHLIDRIEYHDWGFDMRRFLSEHSTIPVMSADEADGADVGLVRYDHGEIVVYTHRDSRYRVRCFSVSAQPAPNPVERFEEAQQAALLARSDARAADLSEAEQEDAAKRAFNAVLPGYGAEW